MEIGAKKKKNLEKRMRERKTEKTKKMQEPREIAVSAMF